MVKFCRICPKCRKTFTNGAYDNCGDCQTKTINIKEKSVVIDGDLIKLTYEKVEDKTAQ